MPLESAYSWGLNRATFIAAAKRGFKSGAGDPGKRHAVPASRDTYFLGDDMAFKTEKGGTMLFTFGGKVQTMEEFDRRVRARFGDHFDAAWGESIAYVRKFDRETLESTQAFFDDVYRPVRDKLADEWTAAASD